MKLPRSRIPSFLSQEVLAVLEAECEVDANFTIDEVHPGTAVAAFHPGGSNGGLVRMPGPAFQCAYGPAHHDRGRDGERDIWCRTKKAFAALPRRATGGWRRGRIRRARTSTELMQRRAEFRARRKKVTAAWSAGQRRDIRDEEDREEAFARRRTAPAWLRPQEELLKATRRAHEKNRAGLAAATRCVEIASASADEGEKNFPRRSRTSAIITSQE